MPWPFQKNQIYNRRRDIHAPFGGQQQGGICTPSGVPGIFIITGDGAHGVGYADKIMPDGSIRYTGEGQVGDMQMVRGNRSIRDHVVDGKDLLLFRKARRDGSVEFLGQFVCEGWEPEQQPDRVGRIREAIVFALVPVELVEAGDTPAANTPEVPIDRLRAAAYAAAAPARATGKSVQTVFQRSRAVKDYVLARAKGRCEACKEEAPFMTAAGRPYLEPHHIRRLSDGGPDDPATVAAICPNCHREAHFGVAGPTLNIRLAAQIAQVERVA